MTNKWRVTIKDARYGKPVVLTVFGMRDRARDAAFEYIKTLGIAVDIEPYTKIDPAYDMTKSAKTDTIRTIIASLDKTAVTEREVEVLRTELYRLTIPVLDTLRRCTTRLDPDPFATGPGLGA